MNIGTDQYGNPRPQTMGSAPSNQPDRRETANAERLARVFDGLQEGLWDWDNLAVPRFWWSPRFYALLGYREGELEPTMDTFLDLLHPDDRPRVQQTRDRQVGQPAQPVESEYRLRTKSGEYRWFHARGQTIAGPDGRPVRMVGSIRDITALKQAESALQASEAQHRNLIQNMPAAVVVHGPDGRILFSNPMAASLLGLSPDQLESTSARDPDWHILHEDGQRMAMEDYPVQRVLATGQPIKNLIAGIRRPRHGDQAWGLVNAYPEFDDQQRIRQVVVTFTDITERKRAEEALRASEAKYRLLHESMRDGIVMVDIEGHLREFNTAYQDILGYRREELLQLTYQDITPRSWWAMESRIVTEQIIARGYSDVYEKEYRRKDGVIVPVEIRAILVRDETGRPASMWGIVRDITERKRAEATLMKSRHELEVRVQERTADLARMNERLRALTTKLASTEDEERLRVARLVHDSFIQTLSLAHIQLGGIDQALRQANLPVEATRAAEVRALLKEAISQGRLLVSDLAPPMLYELGLIPALQDLSQRLARPYGIPIQVSEDEQAKPMDNALRGLLYQCARELLTNALKHAHASAIEVTVTRQGDELCLTVSDQGVGFGPDQLQARAEQEPHGFGLFHIRQRVAGLGGAFEISSAPGRGTRATIRVPLTPV